MRKLYKAFGRFSFALALLLCSEIKAESISISIGAIASLSGPASEQGRNWIEGAQLAADELKASGIDVNLVIEDDQTSPAKVHSAFKKLATINKVKGIIGGTWDFLAEAASPLSFELKIPFLTPTNPVEILGAETRKNPYFFTNGLSLSATSEAIRAVIERLASKRIAIVAPNVPFGVAHADIVQNLSHKMKFQIIEKTLFDYAGYHDVLRTTAARLTKEKPDLIFCLSDYSALDVFMNELERHRFSPKILTTQHLDEAVILSKRPSRYANAIGIYPMVINDFFNERFFKKFGHKPKVYSAQGYDALSFLAQAIAKNVDLASTSFEVDGVCGKLRNIPGNPAIAETKAVAVTVNSKGDLIPF